MYRKHDQDFKFRKKELQIRDEQIEMSLETNFGRNRLSVLCARPVRVRVYLFAKVAGAGSKNYPRPPRIHTHHQCDHTTAFVTWSSRSI